MAANAGILWCAQCENTPATMECFEEELLYCVPCAASLHSKRARLHHSVMLFKICDECEEAVARVKCALCSGKDEDPLAFCEGCSGLLHSKRARKHHNVQSLRKLPGAEELSLPPNSALDRPHGSHGHVGPEDGSSPHTTYGKIISETVAVVGSICKFDEVPLKGNDATSNAARKEEGDERAEHSCEKIFQAEGVSEKDCTSNSPLGNTFPVIGSCSVSGCNQLISEVSLGEFPPSEFFCGLVSGMEFSSEVSEKTCAGMQVTGVQPIEVPKVSSLSDPPAMKPPAMMNPLKEELIDNCDQVCEGPPDMNPLKEGLTDKCDQVCEGPTDMNPRENVPVSQNSSEEHPMSTPYGIARRSRVYMLRNYSAKMHEAKMEEEKFSKEIFGESSDEEDPHPDGTTVNQKIYARGSVTIKALVKNKLDYDIPYSITGRIFKILEHGLHFRASDAEARRAIRNAQRQLTKFNLKQACTLEGVLQNTQDLCAGLSVVEFVSTGSYQRASLDGWTHDLAFTIAKYFATEYCAQKLKVIFYGIEQNASCAARAFAATFNRVVNLSADFVPEKLLDEGDIIEIDRVGQCANKSVFSRKSRLAYRKDLVDALFRIPESSRWQQEERSKVPAFVGASANWVRDGVSFVPSCSSHSVWLDGVPRNKTLVKRYGYEVVKALALHSRKVCRAFLEKKKWMVVRSRLKDPVLG